MSYEISSEAFLMIHQELGGKQAETAKILGVSQAAVSNYLRGAPVSKSQATKIVENFEAFKNRDPNEKPAFVEVNQVRDTSNGRVVNRENVSPWLIGQAQDTRSDADIINETRRRFKIMARMRDAMVQGHVKAMVVSGAAGVGKSFNIINPLEELGEENVTIVKGGVSPAGVYSALYHKRHGGIVVFDDADSSFKDEDALDLFKAALDTTDRRIISWRKKSGWIYSVEEKGDQGVTEDGRYPNTFEFKGGVIFITNSDMHSLAEADTRMSPHYQALISRSMYLDLKIRTVRERILWIEDIYRNHMAPASGIDAAEVDNIMAFVKKNAERMIDLSLRLMTHITQVYKADPNGWVDVIEVMKMK